MKLVVLGGGGYHPSSLRHTACYAIPELGIVLDAGTGFWRLRDLLVRPTLDVFLSHAHLDHVVGLTFLFDVVWGKTMDEVVVHARPQDLEAIQTHLLAAPLFPAKLPCRYQPLPQPAPAGASEDASSAPPPFDGSFSVAGGGNVRTFPLEHPGGSVGYRFDWPGRSLAYVTDVFSRPNAAYLEAIRGVDLLLHECYFPDELAAFAEKTGHSCASAVGAAAAAANVGRLVLIHPNPLHNEDDPVGLDVVRRFFPNCDLARDGDVIEF